jgi:hypothetical protein
MTSNLRNDENPPQRSASDTSAHSIPAAPSTTSSTGNPPAGVTTIARSARQSIAGISANSHSAISIPLAVVDQGIETATAMASQSVSGVSLAWSKNRDIAVAIIA